MMNLDLTPAVRSAWRAHQSKAIFAILFVCFFAFSARADKPKTPFDYESAKLEVKLGDPQVQAEFTRVSVTLTNPEGETIPLLLSLPLTGQKPYPIVVMFHGAVDDRKENLSNAMSGRLARRGIACISMDLPGHGARGGKDHVDFKPALRRLIVQMTTQKVANALGGAVPAGMDEKALTEAYQAVEKGWKSSVIDGRRVIDYLLTRDDIDPKKIAVFGQSMGGDIAFWIAASDPRVIALATGITGAFDLPMPAGQLLKDYMGADALKDYGQKIAPRPVLVIASKDDPLVSLADYQRLIDVLNKPTVEWVAKQHNITRPGFDVAAEWFSKQLQPANSTTVPATQTVAPKASN